MIRKEPDNFIDIPFSSENLDRYLIRSRLLEEIKMALPFFSGDLIDIGCGKMPYREYLLNNSSILTYTGLDITSAIVYDENVKADFYWDGTTMPFDDGTFDTAIATEVLEHCPKPETTLAETNRVLKPGGAFFFTVPFLWPLHEVPHDEYRYTPWSLERHLTDAGFAEIEIKSLGGWHASMAQMLGLWVRRAPMSERKRKLYSWMLMPIIKKLIKIDKYNAVTFTESQMVTGFSGIAYKKSS